MSVFMTRVELHGAQDSDYEVLHAAMVRAGFHRIMTHNGIKYQLPTAEYLVHSDLDAAGVRNAANAAANTTGKTSWILTIQSAGMAWELRNIP
jgi:hypothetical protein